MYFHFRIYFIRLDRSLTLMTHSLNMAFSCHLRDYLFFSHFPYNSFSGFSTGYPGTVYVVSQIISDHQLLSLIPRWRKSTEMHTILSFTKFHLLMTRLRLLVPLPVSVFRRGTDSAVSKPPSCPLLRLPEAPALWLEWTETVEAVTSPGTV